jgi:hypothetical protein
MRTAVRIDQWIELFSAIVEIEDLKGLSTENFSGFLPKTFQGLLSKTFRSIYLSKTFLSLLSKASLSFYALGEGQDVEAKVEGTDAVGEGSYRDDVHAGGGDLVNGVEGHSSAGFDENAAVDLSDGGAEIGERKVVEQDAVDSGGEDGLDLVEAIDLDFEVGGVGKSGVGFGERVGEGGRGARGEDGKVVVLGHEGVG